MARPLEGVEMVLVVLSLLCDRISTSFEGFKRRMTLTPMQEAMVSALCEEFHCTELSATRTVTRNKEDAVASRNEIYAKLHVPCLMISVSQSYAEYAEKMRKSPPIDSLLLHMRKEDRFPRLQSLLLGDDALEEKEDEVLGAAFHREEIMNLRKLTAWWEAEVAAPVHFLFLTCFSDAPCHDCDQYADMYADLIEGEGIRCLLGFVSIEDSVWPFTDYCNARLWGARDELIVSQIKRTEQVTASLLQPRRNDDGSEEDGGDEFAKIATLFEDTTAHHQWLNFFGRNPSTSIFRRHKYLAQRRLAQCGLPHIRSVVVRNAEEALEGIERLGLCYPVVCKPSCGEANILVSRCDNAEMVRCEFALAEQFSFQRCYNNRTFVVEEYVEGDEFVVNTMSLKGKTVVTDVWRSVKYPLTTTSHRLSLAEQEAKRAKNETLICKETTSFIYDYQLLVNDPQDEEVKRVAEYIVRCADSLGVYNGASHCEVRLDRRPQSSNLGKPILIELNARFQGSKPRAPTFVGYSQLSLILYTSVLAVLALYQSSSDRESLFPTFTAPLHYALASIAKLTPESYGWPITPVLYSTSQREAGPPVELYRKVIFLCSPISGVLNLKCMQSLSRLRTFREFSRIHIQAFGRTSVPRVSQTTDLSSSPGALVLEGTQEELDSDTAYIRQLEAKTWSKELCDVLSAVSLLENEDITPELTLDLLERLESEQVLYVSEVYISFFVRVVSLFRSLLPDVEEE